MPKCANLPILQLCAGLRKAENGRMNSTAQEVLAVSIAAAARLLGLSPRTVADLIARNELPSKKVGRRRLIPLRALQEFISSDHDQQEKRREP